MPTTVDPSQIRPIKGSFVSTGLVALRATGPFQLWAVNEDGEPVLMHNGIECDVRITPGTILTIKGKAQVFAYMPEIIPYEPTGEIYSNADQMPVGIDPIKAAMHLLRLENRHEMRAMRAELQQLAQNQPDTEPDAPEPDNPQPEPLSEDAPEPEEQNEGTTG